MGRENEFRVYVPAIFDFINKVNQKSYMPSIVNFNLIKPLSYASIGIIGDFCEVYRSEVRQFLNVNLIDEMANRIRTIKNKKYEKTLDWCSKVILNFKSFFLFF